MRIVGIITLLAGLAFAWPQDIDRPFPTKRVTLALDRERDRKPMAVIRCISQDGDWTAGGSWAGGVAPGSSDTALFDGTTQRDMLINLANAADLANLVTTEAYRGNIGTNGNPLICDVTNRMTIRGSGRLVWTAESTTSGGVFITINSTNMVGAALFDLSAINVFSHCVVRGGLLELAGSSNQFHFIVDPQQGNLATLDSPSSVSVLNILTNFGGRISGMWDGANGFINNITGTMDFSYLDLAGGQLNMFGGTFSIANNSLAGTHTIGFLNLHGGSASFVSLVQAYTISNLTQFGGTLEANDFLTITKTRDISKEYPDF